MALIAQKTFKVYLDGDYYDTFKYIQDKKIYQGDFGYMTIDSMVDAINGLLPHIHIEVANE